MEPSTGGIKLLRRTKMVWKYKNLLGLQEPSRLSGKQSYLGLSSTGTLSLALTVLESSSAALGFYILLISLIKPSDGIQTLTNQKEKEKKKRRKRKGKMEQIKLD